MFHHNVLKYMAKLYIQKSCNADKMLPINICFVLRSTKYSLHYQLCVLYLTFLITIGNIGKRKRNYFPTKKVIPSYDLISFTATIKR